MQENWLIDGLANFDLVATAPPQSWSGGYVHPAWRVAAAGGVWFVKRYEGSAWPPAVVHTTLALQQQAADAGQPVPRVLRTRSGEWTAAVPGGHLAVMRWAPGETKRSGLLTEQEAAAAGFTLARLHTALRVVPVEAEPFCPDFGWIAERAQELLALEAQRPLGGEAGEIARAAAEYRLRAIATTAPRPELYADAGWQVCHGDYYPPNLLFADGAVSGVVDWDFAGPRWRAVEIARAAVEAAKGDDGSWQPRLAEALLRGYQEAGVLSQPERVNGFRMWWEYLLYSRYPWPLPYTAPEQAPKAWLAVAQRRHSLMVWLGEHMAELEELAQGIGT